MSVCPEHSNNTMHVYKQDFGLTGFPRASSRVSVGSAGDQQWGSPCYTPLFWLAFLMGGVAISMYSHMRIMLGHVAWPKLWYCFFCNVSFPYPYLYV